MADNKRARLLYLMQILQEETGEQHPLTIPQMIARLQGFGIRAERRCLRSDQRKRRIGVYPRRRHGNQPPQFEKTSLTKVIGGCHHGEEKQTPANQAVSGGTDG